MKIALLTLSTPGSVIAERILKGFPSADLYVHKSVGLAGESPSTERFEKIKELTAMIFNRYEGLVYIAPAEW